MTTIVRNSNLGISANLQIEHQSLNLKILQLFFLNSRALYDLGSAPADLSLEDWLMQDVHTVSALVKLFFRELPDSVLGADVYPDLREADRAAQGNSDSRVAAERYRAALERLPAINYR